MGSVILSQNAYLLADYGDVTGNTEEWKFTNCSTDVADGAVSIDGSVLEDRIRERDKLREDEEEDALEDVETEEITEDEE